MNDKRLHGIQSKYKGVCYYHDNCGRSNHWALNCYITGNKSFKRYPFTEEGEREAAKAYDTICIINGKKPVNILKSK